MICQFCNERKADTYIKTIISGEFSELYLCSICAEQKYGIRRNYYLNITNKKNSSDNSFISQDVSTEVLKCNFCGSTLDEILYTGKVGCANCYSLFKNYLISFIEKTHGTVEYMGKIPKHGMLAVFQNENSLILPKIDTDK